MVVYRRTLEDPGVFTAGDGSSMPADARAEALHALGSFLVARSSTSETLRRISDVLTTAIPAARYAGLALLDDDGRPRTPVATDERVPEIDSAQYESGRGPCLEAWATKRTVRVDVLDEATDRYPEFVELAGRYGIASTLSLPLVVQGQGIGALNLYAEVEAAFTPDDETLGTDLVTTAAAVLANSGAYWEAVELSHQLGEAMVSRAVIEQAKGMLMAGDDSLTSEDAFTLMRQASQRENVKLRAIAQHIVERRPWAGLRG